MPAFPAKAILQAGIEEHHKLSATQHTSMRSQSEPHSSNCKLTTRGSARIFLHDLVEVHGFWLRLLFPKGREIDMRTRIIGEVPSEPQYRDPHSHEFKEISTSMPYYTSRQLPTQVSIPESPSSLFFRFWRALEVGCQQSSLQPEAPTDSLLLG